MTSGVMTRVPDATVGWLTSNENPAVAVLTKRYLLGEPESADQNTLWSRRNDYAPVAAILEAMSDDGSWAAPGRDYQKYRGSLWQIHLLGELYASDADERVRRAAEYAFSRQLPDGSWSCSNARAAGSIPCLTANVARALARLGYARDPRVVAALDYCTQLYRELGAVDCRWAGEYHLNGYCHMLTPKLLLLLGEVPRDLWPAGADDLRDACVQALRDKQVFNCLPAESGRYQELIYTTPSAGRTGVRQRFLAENTPLHYGPKPGWLRFGYPLSYNSDVLECLAALAGVGETPRPEYSEAVDVVRSRADANMRWKLQTTLNGKMFADVERKGDPSRWLTLRALRILAWAEE